MAIKRRNLRERNILKLLKELNDRYPKFISTNELAYEIGISSVTINYMRHTKKIDFKPERKIRNLFYYRINRELAEFVFKYKYPLG